MADEYVLSNSGVGDGTYETTSARTAGVYYYYRSTGDNWHFTFLPTGRPGGSGGQQSMRNKHISIPIPGHEGFNAHFFFSNHGEITGNNRDELPSAEQVAFDALVQDHGTDIAAMAVEMVGLLNFRPPP